jgi:AcrR family transcriptional regulator
MVDSDASQTESVEPRERIVRVAARLLADGGKAAVTTRAVEAAASVQAPTIYRLFGDKHGLMEAVAEHQINQYVNEKSANAAADLDRDPVDVLRDAWRMNVQFGLDNPALFSLINGDPRPEVRWSAAEVGMSILRDRVRRIARAGRLKVGEERAINLIIASARGAVFTLVGMPEQSRDLGMLDDILDGLISTMTTEPGTAGSFETPLAANALRAALREGDAALSPGEQALLDELLVRLASAGR